MLEELQRALADRASLLALGARLVVVASAYAVGLTGLRRWKREAKAAGRLPRLLAWAWLAAALAVAVSVAAFSLGLRSLAAPYRWGADLSGYFSGRIVGVLGTIAAAYVALGLVSAAVARLTPEGVGGRREVRLETLRGVLGSGLRVAIVIVACASVLGQLGVNVAALLAGVSILGLAVSFGAQSLVKDIITGFFVLLEDQYGVGDIVRVNGAGGLSGSVESVGLRTTVLRDLDGTAHVVPNGQILTVSVLSKEWSRAVVDIEVGAAPPLDTAIALFERVAADLYADPAWANLFLEPPEVLGVQRLSPTGATIRTLMKVQPKEQWVVSREFRRRVKNALDRAAAENVPEGAEAAPAP